MNTTNTKQVERIVLSSGRVIETVRVSAHGTSSTSHAADGSEWRALAQDEWAEFFAIKAVA